MDFALLCPTMPESCPGILETSLEQAKQAYGDVDGNGLSSPMQDGQVVYRYLLGLRGQDLIQGVVDPTAPRHTPEQVESFLSTFESSAAFSRGKRLERTPSPEGRFPYF